MASYFCRQILVTLTPDSAKYRKIDFDLPETERPRRTSFTRVKLMWGCFYCVVSNKIDHLVQDFYRLIPAALCIAPTVVTV